MIKCDAARAVLLDSLQAHSKGFFNSTHDHVIVSLERSQKKKPNDFRTSMTLRSLCHCEQNFKNHLLDDGSNPRDHFWLAAARSIHLGDKPTLHTILKAVLSLV